MENGQNYSQNCLYNTNKFLSVYSLVKVAAWQSSNIGCFFWFARHGRALTGVSPEHAQIVGSV